MGFCKVLSSFFCILAVLCIAGSVGGSLYLKYYRTTWTLYGDQGLKIEKLSRNATLVSIDVSNGTSIHYDADSEDTEQLIQICCNESLSLRTSLGGPYEVQKPFELYHINVTLNETTNTTSSSCFHVTRCPSVSTYFQFYNATPTQTNVNLTFALLNGDHPGPLKEECFNRPFWLTTRASLIIGLSLAGGFLLFCCLGLLFYRLSKRVSRYRYHSIR
ncbi:hypothetical protein PROFUN_13794 [Planoprotostelium fungivorum]|uniref:Uncharacterized protein n=1 Tax=Planoprotostelium fungivorum TaxID=1890364 RepID=A0A2P6N384_9EUKA|nr:hypothetical protein PROFUN_13794 [Planoprotostelium fungivorum]